MLSASQSLKLRLLVFFKVSNLGVLASLQGSNVGHDSPPVIYGDIMSIAHHVSNAVGNSIEYLSVGLGAQVALVEGGGQEAATAAAVVAPARALRVA